MNEQIISEFLQMTCGNPGAITVVTSIMREYPDKILELMEKMKESRLYDYHIWVKFKEVDKDIHKFVKSLSD